MSSEQDAGDIGASSLPVYLRAEPPYGVVVCTEHRIAYTPTSINVHLKNAHKASKQIRDHVHQHCVDANVASVVREPPHGSAPISGLQVHTGWQCNVITCNELSQSSEVIERHVSKAHGFNSKRKREENNAVVQVLMQHWFAKSNKYWTVSPRAMSQPPTTPRSAITSAPPVTPRLSRPPYRPNTAASSPPSLYRSDYSPSNRNSPLSTHIPQHNLFTAAAEQIRQDERHIRRVFQEAEHPSEITPWMTRNRYHEHFANVDKDLIGPVLQLPRTYESHEQLYLILQSVRRVLSAAYQQVKELHPIVAMHLNSFEGTRVSQDPFTFLQNKKSLETYITTFQQLICYFYRVVHDEPFDQVMFETTPRQHTQLATLLERIHDLRAHLDREKVDVEASDGEDEDVVRFNLERETDQTTLDLLLALLEHPTARDTFRSAVMSFCAAASWTPGNSTWKTENQAAAVLSRLIYCCQLVAIAHAERESSDDVEFANLVREWCTTWMKHDNIGPVGDILRMRLYAMSIARDVVHPAQIRWRTDDQTLMYRDLTFRISDLATEMSFCLDQAQGIFRRDLCFDLPNIPTFQLRDLEDNWDDKSPGQSFLGDIRNAGVVEDYRLWLMTQVAGSSELYSMVVQHDNDSTTHHDQVRSIFAQEYEVAVQQFLGYMSVLMHKGSGQPGRSVEFLGTRWQNKWEGNATRNLFVHDGYLLYLLTYHKAQHRTHASRYPVRFLLPEVGQLLVQYLVLIIPFRQVLSKTVQIPVKVSEYLWHDGQDIWSGDRFMKFARAAAQQAHGVPVNMQSWRQIAVAIAVKKFGGLDYQADLDLAGDADDDVGGQSILDSWGGAMADVFHLQAAHSANTGNRIYGGSVNFERGLTDAGLQEYFRASRLWHQLCRPRTVQSRAGHRRQASQPLTPAQSALRQRLAYRQRPTRYRQRWGSEQVHQTLRRLFPETDLVTYRSVHQAELIEAIVAGFSEIIGVLATGEGKSLAFLLPACLPGAGTTVVVVPLVALKHDMIRRCDASEISYAVWDTSSDSQQFIGTPLLFVSVEQAVRARFRAFLGQLDAIGSLDRIVFDEAHLVLTAVSYRPKMSLVRQLRQLYCQVVFLTATLPPLLQSQFEERLLLQEPRMIRSRSFRRDITYLIRTSRDANLLRYVCSRVESMLQHYQDDSSARLLIYTSTRKAADDVSARLHCPKYYSDSGDVDEKVRAMQQWRDGQYKVLVATSAFGMGIDFPSVRQVIHMGAPTDMIGFAQEVGRLSRDGQGGFSRVILPRGWRRPALPSVVDQRRSDVSTTGMTVYLGENRCLSAVMSRFLDGAANVQYCSNVDPRLQCTKCALFGLFDPAHEQDDTTWWDPASGQGLDLESNASESATGDIEDGHDDSGDHEARSPPNFTQLSTLGTTIPHTGGRERLRDHMRDRAIGRRRYEEGLMLLRGRCMICMVLAQDQVSPAAQMHELHVCRHIERASFTQAKQRAIERGRLRGGWMRPYTGCFQCGQPQEICPVDPQHGRASDACMFRDIIFPATWGLSQRDRCWGRSLGELSGVPREIWEDEDRWMDWLGTGCELYGMQATQAARMMDVIIRLELADVLT